MDVAGHDEIARRLDYAELALRNGDPAAALAIARESLGQQGPRPSPEAERRARRLVASALEITGDYRGAIAELTALVADPVRDLPWVGLLIALTRCYRECGDVATAISTGHEGLVEVQRAGLADTEEGIRLAVTVASAYLEVGDFSHALRMCERAAERAEAIGSRVGRASAYWNAGLCLEGLGQTRRAIAVSQEALEAFDETGDERARGALHTNLAGMYVSLDPPELEAAESHVAQAERLMAWSEASGVERARIRLEAAHIGYLRGDLAAARADALACLATAEDRAPGLAASCLLVLGRVALAEDRRAEAKGHFDRAVLLLASCGKDRDIARSWYQLGGLLQELGETGAAIDAYRRAAVSTGLVTPDRTVAPS